MLQIEKVLQENYSSYWKKSKHKILVTTAYVPERKTLKTLVKLSVADYESIAKKKLSQIWKMKLQNFIKHYSLQIVLKLLQRRESDNLQRVKVF